MDFLPEYFAFYSSCWNRQLKSIDLDEHEQYPVDSGVTRMYEISYVTLCADADSP